MSSQAFDAGIPLVNMFQQGARQNILGTLGAEGSKLALQTGQRASQIAASRGITGGAGASFVAGREEGVRKDTALKRAELKSGFVGQDINTIGALASLAAFIYGGPAASAGVGGATALAAGAVNKASPGAGQNIDIQGRSQAIEAAGPQVAAPLAAQISPAQGPGGFQAPQGPGGAPAIDPSLLQQALPILGNLSDDQLQLILTLLGGLGGR